MFFRAYLRWNMWLKIIFLSQYLFIEMLCAKLSGVNKAIIIFFRVEMIFISCIQLSGRKSAFHLNSLLSKSFSGYHKDRLKNSVFLSPSVCTKRNILLGQETWQSLCINNAKLRPGVKDLERNKHQLLHRIASVKTPLIYNKVKFTIENWRTCHT